MRSEKLRASNAASFEEAGSARHCAELARRHYENFPVASALLPAPVRPAVRAIYAFARTADDFADEPEHEGWRLQRLDDWDAKLRRCFQGEADDPVFVALRQAIERHTLPMQPFLDLLAAFRLDVSASRHADFQSLLDYSRLSANPVGRLMLHLFGYREESLWPQSDAFCTALQLTNHWQDVGIDLKRGRIYLPADDRVRHGVTEASLQEERVEAPFRALMREEIGRTRELFETGRPLCDRVGGRLRAELRLTWLGGRRVLDRIEDAGFDVFRRRPRISWRDAFPLALQALWWRR